MDCVAKHTHKMQLWLRAPLERSARVASLWSNWCPYTLHEHQPRKWIAWQSILIKCSSGYVRPWSDQLGLLLYGATGAHTHFMNTSRGNGLRGKAYS